MKVEPVKGASGRGGVRPGGGGRECVVRRSAAVRRATRGPGR